MALPMAIIVLAGSVAVQDRVLSNLRSAAFYHAGHVLTPGYSYQLLDDRYYFSRLQILRDMPPDEAGRFAIKAIGSYFAEPLPWKTALARRRSPTCRSRWPGTRWCCCCRLASSPACGATWC